MEIFTITIDSVSITYSDVKFLKQENEAGYTAIIPFSKNLLAKVNNSVSIKLFHYYIQLFNHFFYLKRIL